MASSKIYLYKILEESPPDPLPETLPATDLDKQDGYIHLSEAWRIPVTANRFFTDHTKLWLLKLRIKDLDGKIVYLPELPGTAHVHDSSIGLGKRNVETVIEVDRAGHDDWAEVPELKKLRD